MTLNTRVSDLEADMQSVWADLRVALEEMKGLGEAIRGTAQQVAEISRSVEAFLQPSPEAPAFLRGHRPRRIL